MIMALSGDVNIEGRSTIRPLYLKEITSLIGKMLCRYSLNQQIWSLWEIVNNEPYVVPKITNDKGEEVDKPKDQYTTSNWHNLRKNSIAKTHFLPWLSC